MVALIEPATTIRRTTPLPAGESRPLDRPSVSEWLRAGPPAQGESGARKRCSHDQQPKPLDPGPAHVFATGDRHESAGVRRPEEPLEQPRRRERSGDDGNHTAFNLYLREIGQVKLLTPLEEVELAKRVKEGDKNAREQMIKANLRLVVKIARDYEGIGLPLLDLISEGNLGLMKAVERFDPAKGGKLSTYSSWWIKQAIKRALCNQSKTIRLPVHLIEKLTRMRRAATQLRTELGREPNDEELAEVLGLTPPMVARMRIAALRPASLDAPMAGENSNEFAEVVQDESAGTPYQQLEEKTFTGMLQQLVQNLPAREADVLRARFGLDGGAQQTLEEIGRKFGVTRERVRQIINCALAKLRKKITKIERTGSPAAGSPA